LAKVKISSSENRVANPSKTGFNSSKMTLMMAIAVAIQNSSAATNAPNR
jgi:hypothetical protein